ncbi:hypothetical protein TNCT_611032 [Trichonephila clavata]|uniref:Uncharacterized protein n=1 Tax=Trichonephila clavata TaxID=2740835 RepID=A0A8X6LGP9_TRICU|nr:hypothetical protein TNCT_611032 [Trichonephila clavata]
MKAISILLCAAVLMVVECAPTYYGPRPGVLGVNVGKAETVELGAALGPVRARAGLGYGIGARANAGVGLGVQGKK